MSKYLITKRDDCERCKGEGRLVGETFGHTSTFMRVSSICRNCNGNGYIDTQVELSAALASNTAISGELKRALGTY